MIGYTRNNFDKYHNNYYEHDIKRAVALSGGNGRHYEMFKYLLSHSVYNDSMQLPLHDTRAGQSLLFAFPIGLRIFVSLILYKEELNILNQYKNNSLTNNIIHPITPLYYSTIVSQGFISKRLYNTVRAIDDTLILNNEHLSDLKLLLNIQDTVNLDSRDIKENLNTAFNIYNISNGQYDTFIDITVNNDRYAAIAAITRALNYKAKSKTILMRANERWLMQTSSI